MHGLASMQSIRLNLIATALTLVGATLCGYAFTKLYHARMLIVRLKARGLPVAPGHNFLFGHLLTLRAAGNKLPPGAHYQYMFNEIYLQSFQKEGLFYLDGWPMSGLFLVVISPNAATTVSQINPKLAFNRPELLPRFFKPIAGGPNLFDMPEAKWRPWRLAYSKGFNTEHFLSLVPGMVEQTRTYCETLRGFAKSGNMCYLDSTSLRFTMDLMGGTILNTNLNAQQGYNTLADCMLSQIRWHQPNAEVNPLSFFNVARWYMHWSNGRQMDNYIGNELDKRYQEYKKDVDGTRSRAVIDMILQAYLPDDIKVKPETLDPAFRAFAIRQVRLFVFVGHDSTSSTLCYILHNLSKNPKRLAKIRAEHNSVFGKDISGAAEMLTSKPHLSNVLPYTAAVIKETLRLFPPAGASRQGVRGEDIISDIGQVCPTDEAMLWIPHVPIHRSPQHWVRPEEFIPERFLAEPGHELYPVKGAWRPFEHGGRNCMAQGLVMIELKVVLAMVVREFNFKEQYKEWDAENPIKGLRTYRRERAYLIEEGSAHPVNKYPCKVTMNSA